MFKLYIKIDLLKELGKKAFRMFIKNISSGKNQKYRLLNAFSK